MLKICWEKKKKKGFINSPVHLSAGQEAIPVGISLNRKSGDVFFGNHRSHHHLLSLESNLTKFFAEILCKKNGLSDGYGASMHLVDKSKGFFGSVPIVTGSLSLATGAAFALKQKKTDNIAVAYLGDGATEEGVFHESLLFSGKSNLPILYVIENNEYSSNMHISLRQVSSNLTRFAKAHGINYVSLNGNSIFDVYSITKKIISKIRSSKKPFLIEAKTYRFYGHVDWRDDIDVGIERSKSKLNYWKKKDPINLIENFIIKKKLISQKKLDLIKIKVDKQVQNSWINAIKFKNQTKSDLNKNIFND